MGRKLSPRHFCPSDITMGCQMAGLSRVQVSALLVPFSSCICQGRAVWRRPDAGNTRGGWGKQEGVWKQEFRGVRVCADMYLI